MTASDPCAFSSPLPLALLAIAALRLVAGGDARRRTCRRRQGSEVDARMAELMRAQGEITGHVRGLSERLDGFGHRIGQSMTDTTQEHAREPRQARRAAGGHRQGAAEHHHAVGPGGRAAAHPRQQADARRLRPGAHGGDRPRRPADPRLPVPGDALEQHAAGLPHPVSDRARASSSTRSFRWKRGTRIRAAATPEATKAAEAQFRRDTTKHIQDIADRYFVPGETQDTAFMFVPSESIFADIHERFEDVVQRAHRSRVVIVSPSLLMLSIQVVTSLLRDQRMREQAHVIQEEVGKLMEDVGRLDERVKKLQMHFTQANKDVDDILVSTRQDHRARRADRGGGVQRQPARRVEEPRRPKSRSRPRRCSGARPEPAGTAVLAEFDEV